MDEVVNIKKVAIKYCEECKYYVVATRWCYNSNRKIEYNIKHIPEWCELENW